MPKIKKNNGAPFEKLARFIRGYGYNYTELAVLMGCNIHTASRRMLNPSTFTLGELWDISQKGGIPWDEMKEEMKRC